MNIQRLNDYLALKLNGADLQSEYGWVVARGRGVADGEILANKPIDLGAFSQCYRRCHPAKPNDETFGEKCMLDCEPDPGGARHRMAQCGAILKALPF
jgi:hypothetical protein